MRVIIVSRRLYLVGFLLFILLIPTSLSAQTSLTFSIIENSPPGSDVEKILEKAYAHLGFSIKFEYLPGMRSLISSGTGRSDGEAFRIKGIDKEYPDLVRIDVPILIEPIHFYVAPGKEFPVYGWQSFPDDYVLGYRRGVQFVEKAIAQHKIRSAANNNEAYILKQLDAGYITAAIGRLDRFEALASKYPSVHIVRLDPAVEIVTLYHYLHKRHLDLVPEITRVLSDIVKQNSASQVTGKIHGR